MRSTFYRKLLSLPSSKPPFPTPKYPAHTQQSRSLGTTSRLRQAAAAPVEILRSARATASASVSAAVVKVDTSDVPCVRSTVKAKRTNLTNPADHTQDHEGFYYTVPAAEVGTVFGAGKTVRGTLQNLDQQFAFAREGALMIRQPALEVMDCVKKSNFAFPAVRYVLYGRDGVGKTASLAHLLHFFAANNWIVLHVPRIAHYTKHYGEVAESTFKPGRIDLPVASVDWLQHFLLQNGDILKDPASKLLTHKTYVWSIREETPAGSRLVDVVELGIKRPRFANDAIGVLVRELKLLAAETGQKLGVVMDTVNALWTPTMIPRVDRTTVPPDLVSLFLHFRSALKNDWTNGAIVTCVDHKAIVGEEHREDGASRYLPRYLLRGPGWEHMDPCVPVQVPDYKDKELTNAIDYYLETLWLQHEGAASQKGRDELKFVSGMNPGKLRELVSRL